MSDEPRPLTEDELAALWAEIGREAALASAMNEALQEKLSRYEHERKRADNANVREFRPRPAGQQPPVERGPHEHGNGGEPDPSSL